MKIIKRVLKYLVPVTFLILLGIRADCRRFHDCADDQHVRGR